MIKAIIFDWDGLIVDSMPTVAEGIKATASYYGINISVDDVLNNYVQPREKYYQSLGIDTTKISDLNDVHSANILKYQKPSPLFFEVEKTLHHLYDKKIKLAIASTATNELINSELNRFGLKNIFEDKYVMGGDAKKEEKLKIIASLLNIPLDEILYVGDLPSDVLAAKKVGILSAGVEKRAKNKERLSKENPDYLFDSIIGLTTII